MDGDGGAGPAGMIPHPEVQRLRDELKRESERLMDLLMEIDDIRLQQNPQIEADYAAKVGYLENELLASQIEARRSRRALELARAAINRGDALDDAALGAIEQQLDAELTSWKKKLNDALRRAQELLENRAGSVALSTHDSRELKRLYRELAKRLHPDAHPELAEDARHLFAVAQNMYKNGDLAGLTALSATVSVLMGKTGDATDRLPRQDLMESLETELMAARARVEMMAGQLQELKSAFPYALREQLSDTAWVVARSEELQARIAETNRAADAFREKLHALRNGGAR